MKPEDEERQSWMETTTFHGWSEWRRERGCGLKCIWTLLLLAACGMIGGTVITYTNMALSSSNEWTTSRYEKTAESLEYPIITICNYNRLLNSKTKEYDMSEELVKLILQHFPVDYFQRSRSVDNYSESTIEEYIQWKRKHNITALNLFSTLGHRCADMFYQIWHGDNERVMNVCSGEHPDLITVKSVLNPEFGNCFQLNVSGMTHEAGKLGAFKSLKIAMDVMSSEYLPFVDQNYLRDGFELQLSFDGQVHFGSWHSVTPGFYTKIGMSRRQTRVQKNVYLFSSLLDSPPCLHTFTDEQKQYFPNLTYSMNLCRQACWLSTVINQCRCSILTETPVAPVCEIEVFHRCIQNMKKEHPGYNLKKAINTNCANKCQPACKDDMISIEVSITRLPAKAQMFEFHKSHSLEQFVGNIGGQLGMWAGISALTIAHAVIHLITWLCHLVTRRLPKSSRSVTPSQHDNNNGQCDPVKKTDDRYDPDTTVPKPHVTAYN